MNKTVFSVSKMDCASEEQLVRLKLAESDGVRSLLFDLRNRTCEVIHDGDPDEILRKLDELKLDTVLLSTVPFAESLPHARSDDEVRVLWQVLAINFSFFVIEMIAGWIAGSMGLIADSLDMLADSLVYGMSLFAVGGTLIRKRRVARISGYFQLTLAVLGLSEVVRRFIGVERVPSFELMIGISVIALIGNATCLFLLQKSKSTEVHMKASMIFTSNDVIVNIGVIAAGVLVLLTRSNIPDLVVGIAVFGLVGRGSFRILRLSNESRT